MKLYCCESFIYLSCQSDIRKSKGSDFEAIPPLNRKNSGKLTEELLWPC